MKARDFGSGRAARPAARAYCTALGKSTLFVSEGRPLLPRCDSGQWADPRVRQGRRCRPDPCVMRSAPMPGCPYRTTGAAIPFEVTAGPTAGVIVVPWVRGQETLEGEIVDGQDLSPSLHRQLTEEELGSLAPLETRP